MKNKAKAKGRFRFSQVLILLVLVFLMFLSLVLPDLTKYAAKKEPYEVSVFIRTAESNISDSLRLGMESAAYDFGVDLRFLALSESNSFSQQKALLLREMEMRTQDSAFIVAPADTSQLYDMVNTQALTVPLVTLEASLTSDYSGVHPNNPKMGRALAKAAINDLTTKNPILLLNTSPNNSGVVQRVNSALAELKQHSMNAFVVEYDLENPEISINDLLTEYSSLNIMTFETYATQKVAESSSEFTLPAKIYGTGVSPSIVTSLENGLITAIVAWNDYAVGYTAVEQAVAVISNTPMDKKEIEFSVIRGEKIYEPEVQKLLFPITK